MDDILKEFLTETAESLAALDVALVQFEQEPGDEASLASVFRMLHTIKGTCGFLGLGRLEHVAHAGENVLGKFRDHVLEVTPAAVTLILTCIDRIRILLGELEANGAEVAGDDSELIGKLNDLAEGKMSEAAEGKAPETAEEAWTGPVMSEGGFPVAFDLLAEFDAAMAEEAAEVGPALEPPALEPPALEPVVEAPKPAPKAPESKIGEPKVAAEIKDAAAASIRVSVDVLETLMTQVSELVLTRNQLLQMVRGRDDSEFKVPLQRLSRITSDLQDGVMKTRMQPIGNAWSKLPRIVRDLAVETGKKIDLVMVGAETELDRQVLELIKDPLTHMVRNSADHGLEGLDGRRAAGKDETGRITLKAYHEGGHIIILVADDGKGLDVARIRAKAIANGLATESEIEQMSERQILQFIFRAGFSTAEKVTSVSGRGVGMDVVRTNIEKIGGTVELASIQGRGTSFTIKIPLTLAIVSALVVESAGERFAVPQINVTELVRASGNSEARIEMINASPVLRLRDRLLPLVSLRKLLKLDGSDAAGEQYIVVSQVGTYNFGVIVDRVFDTEEIVVKPVAPILRAIPFYSGNTILGDGSVIMILDPSGIAEAAGQVRMTGSDTNDSAEARAAQAADRTSFLVFRTQEGEFKAVPLGVVARLEEIAVASIEHANGQRVVQYRGQLMPLVPFDPAQAWKETGKQQVVVFSDGGNTMGLVVEEIVDVISDHMNIELANAAPGTIGSAVIGGKAMDVIDVADFLTQACSDWFEQLGQHSDSRDTAPKRALLIEGNAFLRHLMTPRISALGYQVTMAGDPVEALKLAEAAAPFDLVLAGTDMRSLSSVDLVRQLHSIPSGRDAVLVALVPADDQAQLQEAYAAGFGSHVERGDWRNLASAINQAKARRAQSTIPLVDAAE